MKNIKAMNMICIKSRIVGNNHTIKGKQYYVDRDTIYTDEEGDTYGTFYNKKGQFMGNYLLKRFKTNILSCDLQVE